MLKDNFYKIVNAGKNENDLFFSIELNENHSIFQGHFPDNPITPGVVQMEIVKELLQVDKSQKLKMISMSNCKFLAILNPKENNSIDVVLTVNEGENNTLKVNSVFKNSETTFLKMSSIYEVEN